MHFQYDVLFSTLWVGDRLSMNTVMEMASPQNQLGIDMVLSMLLAKPSTD
jgi:hypothetical protein